MTIIMRPKRTAQMCGDPIESDRLRPAFLKWVGRRSAAAVFREIGIPTDHGSRWMSGRTLADRYQVIVRRAMGDAAGAP